MEANRCIKTLCVIVTLFLFNNTNYAQGHWILGGNNNVPFVDDILIPGNNFLGTKNFPPAVLGIPVDIGTGLISRIHINAAAGPNPGFVGIGLTTPLYLLDVNGNIDVRPAAGGYFIGRDMFLNDKGTISNVFCGVSAGQDITSGAFDTYCGYEAGTSDRTGEYNTFVGFLAGLSNVGAPGACALGDYNTFTGERAGQDNTTGNSNCYYGPESGFLNVLGSANCTFGDHSAQDIGGNLDSNSFFGWETGFNMQNGNSNVFLGVGSGWNTGKAVLTPGSFNTFIGGFGGSGNVTPPPCAGGGANQLNPGGNYNITLGYGADAYTGTLPPYGIITDAVAIGAEAIVKNDNQVILGNNAQYVGIGESNDATGPQWNLEISTEHNAVGSGGFFNTLNGISPTSTGFSGLRFRDLTSGSVPAPNPGTGVLAVDNTGKVIYVPQGATFGACPTPTVLPPGGQGLDLGTSGANFYFQGDDANPLLSDVIIGGPSCLTPIAKLNVFQLSPGHGGGTTGIFVTNRDGGCGNTAPIIGIESLIPTVASRGLRIAGWFEADNSPGCICPAQYQYAIFVPQGGGEVALGYPASPVPCATDFRLAVNGNALVNGNQLINLAPNLLNPDIALTVFAQEPLLPTEVGIEAFANGGTLHNYAVIGFAPNTVGNWAGVFLGRTYTPGGVWTASDSILKDNVQPISNAMGTLMQLAPRSFVFDTTGYPSLNLPSGTQYGMIAEAVQRVLPNLVSSITQPPIVDSAGNVIDDTTFTYSVLNYNGFIPFLISGIQQQQLTIDSLRNRMDTFRTVPDTLPTLLADSSGTIYQSGSSNMTQITAVGANNFYSTSDQKCKTGITSIPNPLGLVERMNGIYFNFNQAAYPWKHFPSGQQVGFIAQQVDTVVPQVVNQNDSGYYTMDYGRITPVLVEAMKQQQQTIDSLKNVLNSIQACLSSLCDSSHSHAPIHHNGGNLGDNANIQDVTLSGLADAPLLYQNIPNPFTVGTKINYYLPQGTMGASMVFYDNYGNQIKTVELSQTGNGTLNITPDNLTNGIYSYSLIVNGNVIDTKRMVLQK